MNIYNIVSFVTLICDSIGEAILNMNIGIIGQGFVGKAVYQKFKSFYSVYTYDLIKDLCNSSFDEIVKNCEVIFTCVPTPMNSDGSCSIKILDDLLANLDNKCSATIVILSRYLPYYAKK